MEDKEEKILEPVVDWLTEEVLKRMIELMEKKETIENNDSIEDKTPLEDRLTNFSIFSSIPRLAINRQALTTLEGAVIKTIHVADEPKPYFNFCYNQEDGVGCEERLDLGIDLVFADGKEVTIPGTITGCLTSPNNVYDQHCITLDLGDLWHAEQFN